LHCIGRCGGGAKRPIAQSFLDFTLDAPAARAFFAELSVGGPAAMLAAVSLPSREAAPPPTSTGADAATWRSRSRKLFATSTSSAACRSWASGRSRSRPTTCAARRRWRTAPSGWRVERAPNQVASIALDSAAGRLDIAALRIDEQRLEQVVDGIDIVTRPLRNLIHAFLTCAPMTADHLHDHAPRVAPRDDAPVRVGPYCLPARDGLTDVTRACASATGRTRTPPAAVVLCPREGRVCGGGGARRRTRHRETDVLAPGNLVGRVHAVLLTGGSALGWMPPRASCACWSGAGSAIRCRPPACRS
jgi:hypothetical protein